MPKRAYPYSISTIFQGIKYRSILEARWAVFFTLCGIRFTYEAKKYNLGFCRYIPDFFLCDSNCFFEVKGPTPTQHEFKKAFGLSQLTKKFVHIGSGSLPSGLPNKYNSVFEMYSFKAKQTDDIKTLPLYLLDKYAFNECPKCGKVAIAKFGIVKFLPCRCSKSSSGIIKPKVEAAYRTASLLKPKIKNN